MEFYICVLFLYNFTFFSFYRTINFDLVIDDIRRRKWWNDRGRSLSAFKGYKNKFQQIKSFIFNILYSGGYVKSKEVDHLITLILHAITTILIYIAFGKTAVSFMAAILYCLSPANVQTSIWLNGRRYQLNVIISLLIWWLRPWGLFFYPVAPLLQINAVLSPFLYCVTQWWWIMPLGLLFGLLNYKHIKQRFDTRNESGTYMREPTKLRPRKIILMIKTYGYYFFRCLLPTGMYFHSTFLQTYAIDKKGTKEAYKLNWDFVKGIVSISICSLIIYMYWGTPIAFGMFWFILFSLQWLNLYTVVMTVADRYMAIANVGLMLVLSGLIGELGYTYQIVLYSSFITFYGVILHRDMGMYQNIKSFYWHQYFHYPKLIINSMLLQKACTNNHDTFGAFIIIRDAVFHHPTDYRCVFNMARVLNLMGFNNEAMQYVHMAEKLYKGQLYAEPEELLESLNNLKKSIEIQRRGQ